MSELKRAGQRSGEIMRKRWMAITENHLMSNGKQTRWFLHLVWSLVEAIRASFCNWLLISFFVYLLKWWSSSALNVGRRRRRCLPAKVLKVCCEIGEEIETSKKTRKIDEEEEEKMLDKILWKIYSMQFSTFGPSLRVNSPLLRLEWAPNEKHFCNLFQHGNYGQPVRPSLDWN